MILPLMIVLSCFLLIIPITAQEVTPETTPEPIPESTAEATPTTEQGCPFIVETALQVTEESCDATGRNEVCYGHIFLDASPYDGINEPLNFDNPGDIENLNALASLRLSAMDEAAGSWGVALMQVEAALEDALEQLALADVTFVMFGDVALESEVPIIGVQSAQNLNVRRFPSQTSFVIGSVLPNTTLPATGRLGDSSWIRVRFDTDEDDIGWVFTDLVTSDGEINTLPVIDPQAADQSVSGSRAYGPMQVFYLQSGSEDAPCDAAPESGLLIQTPEGTAEVTLLMNEVDIRLQATAYFQAQPNGDMEIFVVDGSATVTSGGESRVLAPGTTLQIPLDEDGLADGVPTDPEPYDADDVQALPTGLLQIPVAVPPPLDNPDGAPLAGMWNFAWDVTEQTCDNGEIVALRVDDPLTPVSVAEDGSSITLLGIPFNRVETGIYDGIGPDNSGNLQNMRLEVEALDTIRGQAQINYLDLDCVLNVPFTLRLVEPA